MEIYFVVIFKKKKYFKTLLKWKLIFCQILTKRFFSLHMVISENLFILIYKQDQIYFQKQSFH